LKRSIAAYFDALSTKINMNRFLVVLHFFCLSSFTSFGQSSAEATFPGSWTGNWSGTLDIYQVNGIVQSIPMGLEIHPIDTSKEGRYQFGMIYQSKEKDWRPYELVPVDPKRGVWKVDEKNSIAMESYLYGNKLLCWFVVEGNRILCTYEHTGEELLFEVLSGKETPVSTTGNSVQGTETIPEVKTFPFNGFQRGKLKRVP
jgi:hypothetical protein